MTAITKKYAILNLKILTGTNINNKDTNDNHISKLDNNNSVKIVIISLKMKLKLEIEQLCVLTSLPNIYGAFCENFLPLSVIYFHKKGHRCFTRSKLPH